MYRKKLFYLVLISVLVRLLLAATLNLGNDEVYYYTYALHLQSNYFDHPPIVAWFIRVFTFNLSITPEVFVRLGAVVSGVAGTFLTYRIASYIWTERAAWYAAVLYNISIYTAIIAGTFILPDSPQVVFWLAALYYIVRITTEAVQGQKAPAVLWVLAGVFNGLCIMSKVHGVFLWAGFLLFILLYYRWLLASPWLYVSLLISAVIVSPIMIWNIQNHFVTWNYHSDRVSVQAFAIDKDGFIQTILGQLFYNNPVNAIVIVMALVRYNSYGHPSLKRLFLLCGAPIIIVTTGISLFRSVLPHWSGPGFLTLSFLAAAYLDSRVDKVKVSYLPAFLKAAVILMVVVVVGGLIFIKLTPGTIGSKDAATYGEDDFTLDLDGWRRFGSEFTTWYRQAEAAKELPSGVKIVCNKWFPAAHIEYYAARKVNATVIGLGKMHDLHHYAWLNERRPALQKGEAALCIVPSNYPEEPATAYGEWFQSATLVHTFTQRRQGAVSRYFRVYLLKEYNGENETVPGTPL